MNFTDWNLEAGVFNLLPISGRFVRLISGEGEITMRVQYANGDSISSRIMTGLGVDLSHPKDGGGYISLSFESSTTQLIKVFTSHFPTTDNRLTGDIGVSGNLNVTNIGGTLRDSMAGSILAATSTEILDIDSQRVNAVLTFDKDVYLGAYEATEDSGLLLPANTPWNDSNQFELWVYSDVVTLYTGLVSKKV